MSEQVENQDRTFTQDDVTRIVSERLSREREKYADFDELKAKASKLDEIEEAQKSELEKLQGRLAEFESQAAVAGRERDRLQVIAKAGIPAEFHDLVHGDSEEALTASAEKVRKLVEAQNASAGRSTQYVVDLRGDGNDENLALNGSALEDSLRKKLGIS